MASGRSPSDGFVLLRRAGSVSDLLFLYECETREITGLRAIAARLGLTVQAASHTYRGLARRGLVEQRGGRYRSTVQGVDWLHTTLGGLRDDLAERLDGLHFVRATRAVAAVALQAGARVELALRDGILFAAPPGAGGSSGRALGPASAGAIVEVGELEGIVPLPFGRMRILSFPEDRIEAAAVVGALRRELRPTRARQVLTFGLAAHLLVRRAAPRGLPVGRFGVAAAALEATRLGVDCVLVVSDRDLSLFLRQWVGPDAPAPELRVLGPHGPGRRASRRGKRR